MYDHNANNIHAMCGMTYAPALPACDSVSPPGKTSSQPLHHEAGKVDFVTKPPAGPLEAIADLIRCEPDYAWSWHCNLAMPIMDEIHCTHEQANRAAARVMWTLFDVDVTTSENWRSFPWAQPGYDANGSPVTDELSKDLIEAARDAQGG